MLHPVKIVATMTTLCAVLLLPGLVSAQESKTELVQRDRVLLTREGAQVILAESEAKAAEMNKKVNIAIVDDGGNLLLFARMTGARPASAHTALTKAIATATFRSPTGPLKNADGEPNLLLSLSLQNAAAASGGKMTGLTGGVPIVIDGQVVGGIGVGGASGEEDAEIGNAGIQALLKKLEKE